MESKHNRYILAGLTVVCIALIGITMVTDQWLEPLRTGVGYVLIPIQSGVNKVGVTIYEQLSDYGKLKGAVEENRRLQEEIDRLIEENNRLSSEQFELQRLRELYALDQQYKRPPPGSLPLTPATGSRYSGSTKALPTASRWATTCWQAAAWQVSSQTWEPIMLRSGPL